MSYMIKFVKIFTLVGFIGVVGFLVLILAVGRISGLFGYSYHDCSGILIYIFISFITVPWAIVGIILTGIQAWRKQISWVWLLLNIFVGGILPLVSYIGCQLAEKA